jgi:7-alpha-hydroxysteroid dehydrogenase
MLALRPPLEQVELGDEMPAQLKPSGGLEGCSVLVTGGGTGIGAACAAAAAADGAAVTICGRTEKTLVDASGRIAASAGHGGSVRHIVADVTVEDDVARVVAAALEPTGTLDGVVANAGGGGGLAPLHLQDVDEFIRVVNLNLVGTLLTAKHSLPALIDSKGSFVGMSSIAGSVTHHFFAPYTASKGAIEQLVRNGADEYGPLGVRFNAVSPGFITTEIMDGIARDGSVYKSYIDNTPMNGVGEPEDVAQLVRFLIGAESRWITGQVIAVDGGHHLRSGPNFAEIVALIHGPEAVPGANP